MWWNPWWRTGWRLWQQSMGRMSRCVYTFCVVCGWQFVYVASAGGSFIIILDDHRVVSLCTYDSSSYVNRQSLFYALILLVPPPECMATRRTSISGDIKNSGSSGWHPKMYMCACSWWLFWLMFNDPLNPSWLVNSRFDARDRILFTMHLDPPGKCKMCKEWHKAYSCVQGRKYRGGLLKIQRPPLLSCLIRWSELASTMEIRKVEPLFYRYLVSTLTPNWLQKY